MDLNMMTSFDDDDYYFAQTRPSIENLWPLVFGKGGPVPRDILELRGSSRNAIRSVLMEILARMALPITPRKVTSGRDGSILYVTCDGYFNTSSFRLHLDKILTPNTSNVEICASLIEHAVSKVITVDLKTIATGSCVNLRNIVEDNSNIAIVVIDSIDGYEPHAKTKIFNDNYKDKVSHIKMLTSYLDVLTIYIRKDTTEILPNARDFYDTTKVLIARDYGKTGVSVLYCEKYRRHEIIFSEEAMIHV